MKILVDVIRKTAFEVSVRASAEDALRLLADNLEVALDKAEREAHERQDAQERGICDLGAILDSN